MKAGPTLDSPVIGRAASRGVSAAALIATVRPHQWVKNLLLAAPLLLAHEAMTLERLLALLLAFVAFSACASAVYVFNDISDLKADRQHPIKRKRPFASGALAIVYAPILCAILVASAFAITAVSLPPLFSAVLAIYLAANVGYSGWLKRQPMLDVLLLAGMYALRILAGGIAVGVPVSEWLLAFSGFFFISLAFAKRYAELDSLSKTPEAAQSTRGYWASDISLIETLGPTSGYIAVVVFALYINGEKAGQLYRHTTPLWILCGLMLYWISRIWLAAKRGQLSEDPILFAVKDPGSLAIGAATLVLAVLATWGF